MRVGLAIVLTWLTAGAPQARPRLLDAPVVTSRPQGALARLGGETVTLRIAWRPVANAAKYRVTLSHNHGNTDLETVEPHLDTSGLMPGRYQLIVVALDKTGAEGTPSDMVPVTVIDVRTIPPGSSSPAPPTRGAYPVGTRFSAPAMHCETGNAPKDDLLVGPENELRVTTPGLIRLRCGGAPGYFEKQIVIAPLRLVPAGPVVRGFTTPAHVTFASVARIGMELDLEPIGDITLGPMRRTELGLDVPITTSPHAKTAGLRIRSGDYDIGRVELAVVDPASLSSATDEPVAPQGGPVQWKAADLGAMVGAFVPPSSGGGATTIGHPTDAADVVGTGALIGGHFGFFPTRRVGIEAQLALVTGSFAEGSGISTLLGTRGQFAVRALEQGRWGLRLVGGAGAWTPLRERGSLDRVPEGEIHGGVALTVKTGGNLWLRFQLADVLTTARDAGYAHCVELQLGIVTRVGRRDSF